MTSSSNNLTGFEQLEGKMGRVCSGLEAVDPSHILHYTNWCESYLLANSLTGKANVVSVLSDRNNSKPSRISSSTRSPTGMIRSRLPGVGTCLHDLLVSLGIDAPCVTCGSFAAKMDNWGIEVCDGKRRQEIIAHLDEEARKASWLMWAKVALGGYTSSASLLNKAIEMALEAKHRGTTGELL